MEFLKEILGDELYTQISNKINAHNADEANKDKQIKLADLAKGEYVGKSKYDSLQETLTGKDTEITNANNLIAELKKSAKGDEDIQKKLSDYEATNKQLQEQLNDTKLKAAIRVALLSEKAVDVEYLTFKLNEKLKEKGESLELDENDNIKGWSDKLSALKTQFPTQFNSASSDERYQRLDDGRLPGRESNETLTREKLLNMPYAKRAEICESDPEAYRAAMKS